MLTTTETRTSAAAVLNTCQALSVDPPPAVVAASDRYESVLHGYRGRTIGHAPDVLALAVIAAIDAGRDPADDPTVQRVVVAQDLDRNHGLEGQVSGVLVDLLRQSVVTAADDLVVSWRPAFEQAVETVTAAHADLQGADLTDTAGVVRRGPAAAEAWARAQDGIATVTTVNDGWMALHHLHTGQHVKRYRLLTIVKVDPAEWLDRELSDRPADAWAAAGDGLTFSLPTVAAFRGRVAAIDEEWQRQLEVARVGQQAEQRRADGRMDPEFIHRVEKARADARAAESPA